jgi:hypothetical protein
VVVFGGVKKSVSAVAATTPQSNKPTIKVRTGIALPDVHDLGGVLLTKKISL